MIVRKLREDENIKLKCAQAVSFDFSFDQKEHQEDLLHTEVWGTFLDDGETLTSAIVPLTYQSHYGNTYLTALGIGGVVTLPQYRRSGGIRAIFEKLFEMAPERGWALSYLYPFSYDYYRKFGYERVLRRKKMKMHFSMLLNIPRNGDAVLYTDRSQLPDLLDIYERFSESMNLIFRRPSDGGDYGNHYSPDPFKSMKYTYIWHDSAGKAQSYACCSMKDDTLTVQELCYTSMESLLGILGFLRMYEGQAESVSFTNLPELTPLEFLMGNYWNVDYELDSYAMGRVLLPEVLLKNYSYPQFRGEFSLSVEDTAACGRGSFLVRYNSGVGQVSRLSDDVLSDTDIQMNVPALSRLLLGSETLTTDSAQYLPGITVRRRAGADAFFSAFTKRPGHIYTDF